MQSVNYESLRCDILYPELDRILAMQDVNNTSLQNLNYLLKDIHYSFLCEADEAMRDDILDDPGLSSYRQRSYNYEGGGYPVRTNSYKPAIGTGYQRRPNRSGHTEEEMFIADMKDRMARSNNPKVREAIEIALANIPE